MVLEADMNDPVHAVLAAVRRHLGMDVGFIAEFVSGRRVFRYTDFGGELRPIHVGASDPLEASYCFHIVQGRMPQLMTDAALDPLAATMEVTHLLPVGGHLSVPIRLRSGRIFGTLCCFSVTPRPDLAERDLELLRMCSDIVGRLVGQEGSSQADGAAVRQQILDILDQRAVMMVYQPIYRLSDHALMSVEALARFPMEPRRSPDKWFRDAEAVGLGIELEFLALEQALVAQLALPEVALSLNLSPAAILHPRFRELFDAMPVDRLILEITEHAPIDDYADVRNTLRPYISRGLRLAIDDVGAGHSSFRHVLELEPHIVKLDMSLTRNIDADPARRAFGEAITRFGRKMGCEVVAEGVETPSELACLRAIGVTKVQGYLTGAPMVLGEAAKLPKKRFDVLLDEAS